MPLQRSDRHVAELSELSVGDGLGVMLAQEMDCGAQWRSIRRPRSSFDGAGDARGAHYVAFAIVKRDFGRHAPACRVVKPTHQFHSREDARAFQHRCIVQSILVGQGRAREVKVRPANHFVTTLDTVVKEKREIDPSYSGRRCPSSIVGRPQCSRIVPWPRKAEPRRGGGRRAGDRGTVANEFYFLP